MRPATGLLYVIVLGCFMGGGACHGSDAADMLSASADMASLGRPTPEICDHGRPAVNGNDIAPSCGCRLDSECTAGQNGRCVRDHSVDHCDYDLCFSDADCAPGTVCACDAGEYGANICVTAGCTTDADCGGFACSLAVIQGGVDGLHGGGVAYRCHTALDQCTSNTDCTTDAGRMRLCTWGGQLPGTGQTVNDRWLCNEGQVVGPPLCPM